MLGKLRQRISPTKQKKPDFPEEDVCTLATLIRADKELRLLTTPDIKAKNKAKICERIEVITEYVVWGDQNDSNFWEYFLTESVLEMFVDVMKRAQQHKDIVIQLIQSISILISNVQDPLNTNILLSHHSINEFIIYYYNFTDDDIVEYYVSLLKNDNVIFFFNPKLNYFPVLWQAQKFYNHKETMVRTAVRTVILGVMKISRPEVKAYLTSFPFITFYVHFICYLRQQWMDINTMVQKQGLQTLKEALDDQQDLYYFLVDIYEFLPEIRSLLDNIILSYGIIPTIINGFMYDKKSSVQIPLGLYILTQLLVFFKDTNIPSIILQILFSPKTPSSVMQLIETKVPAPHSFVYSWSFKTYWDQNFDFVLHHCHKFYNLEYFKQNPRNDYEYQCIVNNVGLGEKPGIVQMFDSKDEPLSDNYVRNITLQFLMTKDDRLLFLMLKLIETAYKQKQIPKDVREKCGLELGDGCFYRGAVSQLLKVVTLDPPVRMCTLILLVQLIIRFMGTEDGGVAMGVNDQKVMIEGYQFTIRRLMSQLRNAFYHDLMQGSLIEYQNKYFHNLENITTLLDPVALLPQKIDYHPDIDLIYRLPSRIQEQGLRDLAAFLIMRKLKFLVDKKEITYFVNNNPTNNWEVGKNYEPDQRRFLPCTIQARAFKDQGEKYEMGSCIPSYFVEDDENFIIVSPDIVKAKWAHILYNHKLKDTEAFIDRSDPRVLMVSLARNNSYQDLNVFFEDHTLAIDAKRIIDQRRQSFKQHNIEQVANILNEAQKSCIDFFDEHTEQLIKSAMEL